MMGTHEEITSFIEGRADDGVVNWSVQGAAAEKFACSVAEIERIILELKLLPGRYRRNQNMLSTDDQLRLFKSKVAVIGCGGLGGYVVEQLARLGVGTLVACDHDRFEEHNLNRQLYATPGLLGTSKAVAARERVERINPAVRCVAVEQPFGRKMADRLLNEVDVVVDAVDSLPERKALAELCAGKNLPLVHGAIAGWFGQVATILPGDETLGNIYDDQARDKGAETSLGTPSYTPAVVAGFQVAEICKLLLGRGDLIRHGLLSIDLYSMDVDRISF